MRALCIIDASVAALRCCSPHFYAHLQRIPRESQRVIVLVNCNCIGAESVLATVRGGEREDG